MASYHRIAHPTGFADAELESYERVGDRLTVKVRAWNEQPLTVVFADVIALVDRGAWQIGDLREVVDSEPETLRAALARQFEQPPRDHIYRVFEFVDPDDVPVLEIVASSAIAD
jgi:hypothetical protein